MHRGSQRKAEKREQRLGISALPLVLLICRFPARREESRSYSFFSAFLCEPLCISVPLWFRSPFRIAIGLHRRNRTDGISTAQRPNRLIASPQSPAARPHIQSSPR